MRVGLLGLTGQKTFSLSTQETGSRVSSRVSGILVSHQKAADRMGRGLKWINRDALWTREQFVWK